jgi:hypothetical protein
LDDGAETVGSFDRLVNLLATSRQGTDGHAPHLLLGWGQMESFPDEVARQAAEFQH